VPAFVTFVQPILLIIAISLYTTAVSISNILTRFGMEEARTVNDESSAWSGDSEMGKPRPAPLDLPRRTGNDPTA
jgi:hypothetical protein